MKTTVEVNTGITTKAGDDDDNVVVECLNVYAQSSYTPTGV